MSKKVLIITMLTLFLIAILSEITASSSTNDEEELFDVKAFEEHFDKGLDHYFNKDYDSAAREFKESIVIDPSNAKAYYFLGYTYYKQGKMPEAMDVFEQGYQLDPHYSPLPPIGEGEPRSSLQREESQNLSP